MAKLSWPSHDDPRNIGAAKTRLSELVAAALRGEQVIIARAGEPAVQLVPVDPDAERRAIAEKRRRFIGSWEGKMPDIDWLEPMSEEELAQWYDAPLFPREDDGPPR